MLQELAIQKEWTGDYKGALANLDKAIRLDPDDSSSDHNSRAIVLFLLGLNEFYRETMKRHGRKELLRCAWATARVLSVEPIEVPVEDIRLPDCV